MNQVTVRCGLLLLAGLALGVASATLAEEITLREVVVSDGISEREAAAIADYFFHIHAGIGCGAPGTVADAGEHWRGATRHGYAGEPGLPILIDKRSGAVSWRGQACQIDPDLPLSDPGAAIRCGSAPS